jgi:hypothetical protein
MKEKQDNILKFNQREEQYKILEEQRKTKEDKINELLKKQDEYENGL